MVVWLQGLDLLAWPQGADLLQAPEEHDASPHAGPGAPGAGAAADGGRRLAASWGCRSQLSASSRELRAGGRRQNARRHSRRLMAWRAAARAGPCPPSEPASPNDLCPWWSCTREPPPRHALTGADYPACRYRSGSNWWTRSSRTNRQPRRP